MGLLQNLSKTGPAVRKSFRHVFPEDSCPEQMLRLMQSERMTTDSRTLWSISGSPFLTEPTIPVMKKIPHRIRSLLTPSPGFRAPVPRVT